MADELEDLGANVILLNTQLSSGKYVVQDRVANAKAKNAQVFVSIHCNSSPSNSSAVGTEVYYFNDYSKSLASSLASSISGAMNTTNRGGKFGRYYVTRDPQMAGVLCEVGFLTNEKEYNKLISDSYQQEVAEAVASSVNKFLKNLGGSSGGGGFSSSGDYGSNSAPSGGGSSSGGSSSSGSGGISLDEEELTLAVGKTATLTASGSDLTWSSDDEKVATVNQKGKVTAVGSVECIISVENSEGDVAECYVTVSDEGGVEEIELSDESLTLYVGEEYELEAYVHPDDAADTELVFSSSNDGVVSVDEDGFLEALKPGRVTITVKNPASGVKATCTIRVKEE